MGAIMDQEPTEHAEELCCSFCRKPKDTASKLISSPSDYPRAYVCENCVDLFVALLGDVRGSDEHRLPVTRRSDQDTELLYCSFCRKSQDAVRNLISGPASDPVRTFICDECVRVCAVICQDATRRRGRPNHPNYHPLLHHPMTSQLLMAVERWIKKESRGSDASKELARLRGAAMHLIRRGSGDDGPKRRGYPVVRPKS